MSHSEISESQSKYLIQPIHIRHTVFDVISALCAQKVIRQIFKKILKLQILKFNPLKKIKT